MARSLTELIQDTVNATTTVNATIPTDLPEYVGSDTENLYVVGHKGTAPVKIKVRANDCCTGIVLGTEGGTEVEGGVKYGGVFATFEALNEGRDALEDNTLYIVNDKGSIELYLYEAKAHTEGVLHQLSGGVNVILTDPISEVSECPIANQINPVTGELKCNLNELVCGDYFFKNHMELKKFVGDTLSMTSAKGMFAGTRLTEFCGDLSALETADNMFANGPALDHKSITYIADTIKDVRGVVGVHRIHISYNPAEVTEEQKNEFDTEIRAKGWAVIWAEGTTV